MNQPTALGGSRTLLKLTLLIPFFLASALHLSTLFRVFAALPLVYAHLRFGRLLGMLCSLTNLGIVWAISGRTDAAWFFVIAIVLSTTFAECIKLKLKLEWIVLYSISTMLFVSSLLLVSFAHKVQNHPLQILRTYISGQVDEFTKNAEKYKATATVSSQDLEKVLVDPEVTKQNLFEALPSVVAIVLFFIVITNLLVLLRLNFQGSQETLGLKTDFFKHWKSPDHMVWLTLVVGFCLVVEIPTISMIALNLFRILMAVYVLHGIAILNYFLDIWKIKGFIRPLGYLLAVTFLLPFIASLGFFDLWFKFREKIKI